MDTNPPQRYTRIIDYVPSFEGPMYYLARRIRQEQPPFTPDEKSIRAEIEQAYALGFLLRDRFDDAMRRTTRLTFKRRTRFPHNHMPAQIED